MNRICLLCLSVLLFACNGSTTNESIIRNNSSKTVSFLLYNNGFIRGDTITIEPAQSKTISIGETSQADEDAPDCARRIDSALVIIEGGGTLLKDISESDNWLVETEQSRNIPREFEHICIFSFGNIDIDD